jgi:hypothetical protein
VIAQKSSNAPLHARYHLHAADRTDRPADLRATSILKRIIICSTDTLGFKHNCYASFCDGHAIVRRERRAAGGHPIHDGMTSNSMT